MSETVQNLGLHVEVAMDYASTIDRVTEALKTEGFGILTEIDVKATLKKKLDVDFRPYVILGACNPVLAHRALSLAPELGLLLPCNVTVSAIDDQHTLVSIVDPLAMLGVVQREDIQPIANEAREKLERVAALLESQAGA